MFGHRTPIKSGKPITPIGNVGIEAGPSEALVETGSLTKVRRSIGEWETGKAGLKRTPPSNKTIHIRDSPQLPQPGENPNALKTKVKTAATSLGMELAKPRGRVAEAKACLIKAKLQINSSRNLKAEIKTEVLIAVETLYRLVKEAEAAKSLKPSTLSPAGESRPVKPASSTITGTLEEHGRLIKQGLDLARDLAKDVKEQYKQFAATALGVDAVKDGIINIKESLTSKVLDGASYAAVAASKKTKDFTSIPQAVHSMVVSSADDQDTSENILEKIRTAVSAKTSGILVDRLRKAKDQKVVLGCHSREEMKKVISKLKADSPTLQVKQVENRDPLVILFGVLCFNSDEEVLGALKHQNSHMLGSIPAEDYRASVKFRRKARNPLESHVVLQVSPRVWQTLTGAGRVHIDLQRVVVKDQSPLMTCSRCLGYGHGRKTCQESVDTCSHCAGSHLRSECPAWKAGESPTCCNCLRQKVDQGAHNAFSQECPIRQKWDALARARVAYC